MLNFGFVENYHEEKMLIYPPAKINIGLYVTEKRTDGYHNISTFFFPLKLYDILEFIPDNTDNLNIDQIRISGQSIPGNSSDNLIIKACEKLRRTHDLPYFKIHLHKNIPIGAGLGGGSSDGASMLKGIQNYAHPKPSISKINDIALSLGSDCRFFLNPVSSFAKSRGEDLKKFEIKLNGFWISIFNPRIHISTKEAYQKVGIGAPEIPLERALSHPLEHWKKLVCNVFEPTIFKLHPEISDLKESLYKSGAVYASMSGSGSSVFGIFKKKINWSGSLGKAHIWTEYI